VLLGDLAVGMKSILTPDAGEPDRSRRSRTSSICSLQEVQRLGFDLRSVSPVASSTSTLSVFFEAITLASCFDATAVALTPSGETVTTKYGIPDFGG